MESSVVDVILICEGVREPPGETEEEKEAAYYAAWQELIDSGLVWSLQGWFGRTAVRLIEAGVCTSPKGLETPL